MPGPDLLSEAYRQAGEHIATLERLLAEARADRDAARHDLHLVRSSTTWRAAGPLRRLLRLLRRPVPAPLSPPAVASAAVSPPASPPIVPAPRPDPGPIPAPEPAPPEPVAPAPPPPAGPQPVDIVICVHDALPSLRACLDSIGRCTMPPYHLILVDDGSGPETAAFLRQAAAGNGATLLRHAEAQGYTRAANAGMRASTAPFVVLLNSDTVVTPAWLDRLLAPFGADPALGLLGPLSNTASWQSVPEIFDAAGDWAANPTDLPPDTVAALVAEAAGGAVPLPFLNGFCLALRRAVLDTVGLFDEDTFGAGYGEENDFCIRARAAGWGLAVATACYVHHAQSMSYAGRRAALSKRADALLLAKHDGPTQIWPQAEACRDSLPLAAARARIGAAFRRRAVLDAARPRFEGRRIAFILPMAERGGGGNVVLQEGRAMLAMGMSVTILTLDAAYGRLGAIPEQDGMSVRSFPSAEALTAHLATEGDRYDAVGATLYRTVFWLPPCPAFTTFYYVQDWEPLFFADAPAEQAAALASYTLLPGLRLLTKTRWNADRVEQGTGRRPAILGPSVDTPFRPAPVPDGPLRVAAMVRPATPRRAPARTIEILARIQAALGEAVAIHVFGEQPEVLAEAGLLPPGFEAEGKLDQPRLAALLARSHLFLDASDYQAMGLTALEAMLSGCVPLLPAAGGAADFIRNGETGLLLDTTDVDATADAAIALLRDPARLAPMRRAAAAAAAAHGPEHAALAMLEALFDA